ncbi:MAG: hypothetical protein HeimC3_30270 [Candidatus Heimdallarchaeota archaeon LC_3]|nr:MAG: hypothetical protein HeimC3_30270 [Candidatus Heimdallarchaeota archaeon LC_3]
MKKQKLAVTSLCLLGIVFATSVIQVYPIKGENLEKNLKNGDYARYKGNFVIAEKINLNSSELPEIYEISGNKSTFKWTVVEKNSTITLLTIEVSIESFYTDSRNIIIKDRIAYSISGKTLGYIPFWIDPENKTTNDVIKLGGIDNDTLLGKVTYATNFVNTEHGNIETISLTKENEVSIGSFFGQANWEFDKLSGLLILLAPRGFFWFTLNYPFLFDGVLKLESTNIELGKSEPVFALFDFFLNGGWILLLGGVIFITIFLLSKKSLNSNRKKSRNKNKSK